MQAASASRRSAIRAKRLPSVRAPWRSRPSRSLSVRKIDSIRWRMIESLRPALGLVLAVAAGHVCPERGDGVGELAAGVALVADDRLAATERALRAVQADLALGPVGGDKRSPHAACRREHRTRWRRIPRKPARVATRVAVAARRQRARSGERSRPNDHTRPESNQARRRCRRYLGLHLAKTPISHSIASAEPRSALMQRRLARQLRERDGRAGGEPHARNGDRSKGPSPPGRHRASRLRVGQPPPPVTRFEAEAGRQPCSRH